MTTLLRILLINRPNAVGEILDRLVVYLDRFSRRCFRNVSEGIKSVMTGIVRHVNSLRKSPMRDCIVIFTKPFDLVLMALIAPMGKWCSITREFSHFTIVSEMKFAIAHVSNKARVSIKWFLWSRMCMMALINNWGEHAPDNVARLVVLPPAGTVSQSELMLVGLDVSVLPAFTYLPRCRRMLCLF